MRSDESALDAALLRLADVLAGVEADAGDYCSHCYSEQDSVALSGPVDAIPSDLLAIAAFEGPDHWDDFANLYKKLTPRIMASLVHDTLHVDEELIAERLIQAGCWSTWADDERTAMLAVCNVWWETTLSSYPRRPEAREVLAFLAATPVPFVDWLEVWNAQPPGPADQHAADLCLWWAGELLGGQLTVGWSDTIDITVDVKRWILDDAPPRLARVPAEPRLTEYLELLAAD
jgi:hypothetical protein